MPTQLVFLDKLQAYSMTLVNRTRVAQLTEICVRDVIATDTHTVNMLPYTAITVHVLINSCMYCYTE